VEIEAVHAASSRSTVKPMTVRAIRIRAVLSRKIRKNPLRYRQQRVTALSFPVRLAARRRRCSRSQRSCSGVIDCCGGSALSGRTATARPGSAGSPLGGGAGCGCVPLRRVAQRT
jgi:hypothetical protein